MIEAAAAKPNRPLTYKKRLQISKCSSLDSLPHEDLELGPQRIELSSGLLIALDFARLLAGRHARHIGRAVSNHRLAQRAVLTDLSRCRLGQPALGMRFSFSGTSRRQGLPR